MSEELMPSRRILALVLAGGEGTRLYPLTAEHAKPALPFAGAHRIVDFVLSTLVNSGISLIYVLAQHKPQSLIEHLRGVWGVCDPNAEYSLDVLLPQSESSEAHFAGTADAVYQNLHLIDRHRPDLVAVFAADQIYRMDVRQMERFHTARGAEVSIAAVPVQLRAACQFGVMVIAADGRVQDFQEKPEQPVPIPAMPSHAYASMGNYLFEPNVLVTALKEAHTCGEHDFGHHLLPRLCRSHRVYAYDFTSNRVPGIQPYEERSYWRDIGTIESYREAQADVAGPQPRFQLHNPQWPIRGFHEVQCKK
jgi:glucose-1-phosphate adenylyltransferase